jgi:hypothetical protein
MPIDSQLDRSIAMLGLSSGGIHTGSGFDQTVIKEGDEFTLAVAER